MENESVKRQAPQLIALALVGLTTTSVSTPSLSQEPAGSIEEIVVTAQRREQALQDVPIAVSAMGGDQIERLNFNTTLDVLSQMPNVTSQNPEGSSGYPIFNIRGVTLLDFSDTNEASVAIYVDEVYIGSPAVQNQQLFDVERVEVLRGPQGTLWGRNATGGLVHYITRKPTEEFEAYVKGTIGEFDEYSLEGAVSGAITDTIRARLSMMEGGRDGWQESVNNGKDFGSIDTRRGARLTVEMEPTDTFAVTANLHYNKFEGDEDLRAFYGRLDPATGQTCSTARVFDSQCVNSIGFRDPDPSPENGYTDETSAPVAIKSYGGWLKAEWDLGFATLTSLSSYDEAEKHHWVDIDGNILPALTFITDVDHEQLSQELRLAGETDTLAWVLGGYYYEDSRFYTNSLPYVSGHFGAWTDQDIDTSALFSQATWSATDNLNLTLGVRYTKDNRDLNEVTAAVGMEPGTRQGIGLFTVSDSLDESNTTWRIAADWHFSADHMLYASVATGFKSGAFNTLLPSSPASVGGADPENTTAYELGLKGSFPDLAKITYNAALFYTEYEDIQAAANFARTINGETVVVSSLDSIGDSEIRGLELELTAEPIQNLFVSLGLGLLDNPEYEKTNGVQVNGVDIEGNNLVMAPDLNYNGTVRYDIPFASGGAGYLMTTFNWQDDVYFGPDNLAIESQDDYAIVNFFAGWTSDGEDLEVGIYLKNAFDEEYFVHSFSAADYVAPNWGRSQNWGLTVKKSF